MTEDTAVAPVRGLAIGDAFGQTLQECWRAQGAPGHVMELVERDDGLLMASDASKYFTPPDQLDRLDRWACQQAAGRVLDIGCGAGRHALALATAGFDVVGMDASPGAVTVARQRGVTAVHGSLYGPPPDLGRFDTILLLGNNLGLLGGADRAHQVLRQLAGLAHPNARLIGTGTDPYGSDNPDHLAYHEHNRRHSRMAGQLRLRIRHGRTATEWFDYLFASIQELSDLTDRSPWKLEHVETEGAAYIAQVRKTA
ncbi:class I SAM-dependent methyltransferase [Sphaerisporangium sp. NPDC051017]|uniref:class I SAM-dependent methyltransferase n=1 Tax=Sphaerisporangium sp. NPDC051017 TaxID=3154636 RepID=UPI003447ACCF